MERDVFANISPLDHRYYVSNPSLMDDLSFYLSENAYIRYELSVEAALAKILAARGMCSHEVAREIAEACGKVTPEEVYKEEEVTKHNIRALVNCIQRKVSDNAKPYVHFTTTSVDIMDTASSLRYKDVTEKLVLPVLLALEKLLIEMTAKYSDVLQIGRTHGQHAVPITFGFALAQYVSRLGNRIEKIKECVKLLTGKIAGAVGAYNASHLFFPDPEKFEAEVLAELGLSPAEISTQIVPPEPLTDYVHYLVSAFGVLANLADDLRHLQRSEIAEVGEKFEKGQVGSSTMPHKRNPWNFEHVKSLWKEFMPRMVTVYMDQISEHQRDLTNSASGRFVPEIVTGLVLAADRLHAVMSKLTVDLPNMEKNFNLNREMIIAEPLYILLAAAGHPDAHETVKQLTLLSQTQQRPLRELLPEQKELQPFLAKLTPEQMQILQNPAKYQGIAAQKAKQIAQKWQARLNL